MTRSDDSYLLLQKTGPLSFVDTFDSFSDTDQENGRQLAIMAKVFYQNGFILY